MTKTCIYTVILGGYDNPSPIDLGWDCFLFTDDPDLKVKGWQTIVVEKTNNPIKQQRDIKIRPHHYLPEYSKTVYIDGNMAIKTEPFKKIVSAFLGDFLAIQHPKRKTVRQEAMRVLEVKKDKMDVVGSQMISYGRETMKSCLYATGFLIRRNKPEVNKLCDSWAEQVKKHSHRDQLSLPHVSSRSKVSITQITWNNLMGLVKIKPHKINGEIKVYYSSPFRDDKNIGKANNEFVELLPDDAYVCLTDADALFLQPDYGKQIQEIIRNNPEYGLIGCVTNRLGGLHQCYKGEFSDEMNVRKHYYIANQLRIEFGSQVEETSGVAGLCLIFSKANWLKVGGFVDGIRCDTAFNRKIKALGLKVGLAKSLYMFHCYRIGETTHKKAWDNIKHLV